MLVIVSHHQQHNADEHNKRAKDLFADGAARNVLVKIRREEKRKKCAEDDAVEGLHLHDDRHQTGNRL